VKTTKSVAKVHSIHPLTDSILQLSLSPKTFVDYSAGQYLHILSLGETYPFSIANASLGSHKLELHIRHTLENPYNQSMLNEIKNKGEVLIEMPFGRCDITSLHPTKPIVFMAGGTGFAPVKAMIEQLLADCDERPIHLFWGARSMSDLYLEEMVLHWAKSVSHFDYHGLIDESKSNALSDKILKTIGKSLNTMQVVACGPFDMVYQARDTFVDKGFLPQWMFSDAFSFEGK
jgi:CDP-4-dehydro-6-deoxyglucose reductase, E3